MHLDKIAHAAFGGYLALLTFTLLTVFSGLGLVEVSVISAASSFLLGIGKEQSDRHVNHRAQERGLTAPRTVDPLDMWATFAGGVITILPLAVLHTYKLS